MWKQLFWVTVVVLFFAASNVIGDGGDSSNDSKEIDFGKLVMECNETFRIESRYLDALNESGSFPDETDRTPKCFLKCVLEKAGVANADGGYDSVQTAAVFQDMRDEQDDVLEGIAGSCSDRKEPCKCERAYQYMKCLIEKVIKMETGSDTKSK